MATQVDLVEVLAEGLAAVYDDTAERIQATWDTIETLRKHRLVDEATAMQRRIDREECIKAMVCPDCGEELEVVNERQYHAYGSTAAVERLTALRCPVCGEV
jgi:predicted RNA-binding Zn-ribbon protein involved in translation (DUF1610 family)